MSTGTETPATFSEGTKEDMNIQDQDDQVPQSTILYLLQEATKLAPPAEPLEWRLTSGKYSKEQSQPYPSCLVTSTYAPPVPPVQACKHGQIAPNSQHKYSGSFSLLPSHQSSSPWEVMSLINLQCERLLHPVSGDGEDGGDTALLSTSAPKGAVGYLKRNKIPDNGRDESIFREVDRVVYPQSVRDIAVKSESWTFRTREENVWCTEENNLETSSYSKASSAFINGSTQVQSAILTGENEQCPVIHPEVTQDDGETCLSSNDLAYSYHLSKESLEDWPTDRNTDMSSIPGTSGKGSCFLDKCSPPVESLSMLASIVYQNCQKHGQNVFAKPEDLAFPDAAVYSYTPAANLDGPDRKTDGSTSSILPLESHKNEQRPSSSSQELSRTFDTTDLTPDAAQGMSSLSRDSIRTNRDNTCLKLLDPLVAKVDSGPNWRGRTPRKQRHPTRSADLCDPDFQGVSFRMRTEFNDSRDQCRLLITSKYSAEFWKSGRRARGSRMRSMINSLKTSSSEEEVDPVGLSKNKMCASCSTKTTPLWRDAEDGTPLCNACGIRYKKYRVRCHRCWYIPKKEGNASSLCSRCGDALKLASSHRKSNKEPTTFASA